MRSVQARRFAGVGAVLALCLLAAVYWATKSNAAPSPSASSAAVSSSWSLPGANLQNTRDVASPINSSNVSKLGVAWTVPITATGTFGGYATTPVESNGVMYTQDLASNVSAIKLSTGKVLWVKKYNSPDEGPNGVTIVGSTIYGATGTSAFALQAATGEQLWIKKLTRNGNEGIDMAPGFNNGTVYVSTVPGNAKSFYAGDGKSYLWALNAKTGATKWKWDEVQNLWGNEKINSGGGQWDPPSFDSAGNVYIGVANPAPFIGTTKYPFGSSHPGPNLYTDSVVKLDGNTGKLDWYYQLTPHDIHDWDMQNSPILTTANGKAVAIDGGKAGIVVEVNASTGKLLWKTPVGVHNGHDNDGLLTENGPSPKVKLPMTFEPSDLGGVESQLASNGKDVFAAVNNAAVKLTTQVGYGTFIGGYGAAKGELVALSQDTGKVVWDDKLPSSPYGAVTITNNVVFTTTYAGELYAFNAKTGAKLWETKLSAGTNSPVAVFGNTVVTAGSAPSAKGQKAEIIAYRLGATGKIATASSASAKVASATLAIAANPYGQLAFTKSKLTAKAGKTTVVFTNASPLDHDVVIATSKGKVVGKTPIFAKGKKSFSVTLVAGKYVYYCSVPGHREAGMQGTLTVTK
jgi:outer membrane protein assembly factor BamB